jgi:hypothetical protein
LAEEAEAAVAGVAELDAGASPRESAQANIAARGRDIRSGRIEVVMVVVVV